MSKLLEVNDESFDKEVLQSEMPVLVDFGATWCSPCKRQLPILENMSDDFKDKIKFVSLDVDDSPIASSKFSVKSIPTIMIFSGGKSVGSKTGLMNPNLLKEFISNSLK